MKCRGCEKEKPEESFPMRKDYPKHTRRPYCYECARNIERARYERYKRESPFKHKASRARSRASSLKVPCDIDEDYLESIWTDTCPVLGIPISISTPRGEPGAAELDRFDPFKGYVKGNVVFLSRKANNLKNQLTVETAFLLYQWMKKREDNENGN
jgi:hypothetical protein